MAPGPFAQAVRALWLGFRAAARCPSATRPLALRHHGSTADAFVRPGPVLPFSVRCPPSRFAGSPWHRNACVSGATACRALRSPGSAPPHVLPCGSASTARLARHLWASRRSRRSRRMRLARRGARVFGAPLPAWYAPLRVQLMPPSAEPPRRKPVPTGPGPSGATDRRHRHSPGPRRRTCCRVARPPQHVRWRGTSWLRFAAIACSAHRYRPGSRHFAFSWCRLRPPRPVSRFAVP
ncbi:hypothetical protein HNR73_003349 [Phytomonospora endophytica]|uniref:Uncharacterized protein n=1 Tax=Phytomonospora endophytica TaxID=714109 RepID=A0A841FPL6_9ACTN|nr:hypothetical protein [Phytomonospora endophytica]